MRSLLPFFALITACSTGYEPEGEAVDFDVYVPSLDGGADTAEVVTADFVDDEPEAATGLVKAGVYEMFVEDMQGASCRAGLAEGATIDVLVEPVEGGIRVMDLVTLEPTTGSRAFGVSSRTSEIGESCVLSESVFASATLYGERSFEARFEVARSLSGEGCEAITKLPEPCHGAWRAGLSWSHEVGAEPQQ